MGVKLNKETSDVIHVSQMKDGQIAQVVSHPTHINWVGSVVKRNADCLFSISNKDKFNGLFMNPVHIYKNFKVRILKNGETLTITDNE